MPTNIILEAATLSSSSSWKTSEKVCNKQVPWWDDDDDDDCKNSLQVSKHVSNAYKEPSSFHNLLQYKNITLRPEYYLNLKYMNHGVIISHQWTNYVLTYAVTEAWCKVNQLRDLKQ